ncbi:MAG: DUF2442 domain-containing protein [Acidobacteria bacterium]|nr:DUF2442 domain-containing protein [Acidobacteriota bacterium]
MPSNSVTVSKAEYVKDHILELTFSDGVRAEIDFAPWIEKYPFFAPLKALDYFCNFSLDGWTVVWPNGADIAPETLHELAVKSLGEVAA